MYISQKNIVHVCECAGVYVGMFVCMWDRDRNRSREMAQ